MVTVWLWHLSALCLLVGLPRRRRLYLTTSWQRTYFFTGPAAAARHGAARSEVLLLFTQTVSLLRYRCSVRRAAAWGYGLAFVFRTGAWCPPAPAEAIRCLALRRRRLAQAPAAPRAARCEPLVERLRTPAGPGPVVRWDALSGSLVSLGTYSYALPSSVRCL